MRRAYWLAAAGVVLGACMATVRSQTKGGSRKQGAANQAAEQQGLADYSPKSNDAGLTRGSAFVDRSEVVEGKLRLQGNLPTPCHELRVRVPERADDGVVAVEVYSLSERRAICAQMLKHFAVEVALSPEQAKARVTINGQPVGVYDR